jgi:hypothetical protein
MGLNGPSTTLQALTYGNHHLRGMPCVARLIFGESIPTQGPGTAKPSDDAPNPTHGEEMRKKRVENQTPAERVRRYVNAVQLCTI